MNWIRRYWFYSLALIGAALHSSHIIAADWVAFALLLAAGVPAWLPTLARYIKALEKTEDGWKLLLREDPLGLPAEQIQKIIDIQAEVVPQAALPAAKRTYAELSVHARRVLKSLWHFQCQTFGEDDARRWGFGVGRQAPDYATFSIGAKELEWDKYVFIDPRGLAYLTNEGVELCRQNKPAIQDEPLYYKQFTPAPTA